MFPRAPIRCRGIWTRSSISRFTRRSAAVRESSSPSPGRFFDRRWSPRNRASKVKQIILGKHTLAQISSTTFTSSV